VRDRVSHHRCRARARHGRLYARSIASPRLIELTRIVRVGGGAGTGGIRCGLHPARLQDGARRGRTWGICGMRRSIRRGQERVRARVGQRSLGRRAQGMRSTCPRSRRGIPRPLSGALVLLAQSEREGAHRPPARHIPTSAFLSSPRPACALAFPRPAPHPLPHRFHFFLAFSCAGVPTSAVSGWAKTLTLDRRGERPTHTRRRSRPSRGKGRYRRKEG
jgi:hypothetical protein